MFCEQCGASLKEGERNCSFCNRPVPEIDAENYLTAEKIEEQSDKMFEDQKQDLIEDIDDFFVAEGENFEESQPQLESVDDLYEHLDDIDPLMETKNSLLMGRDILNENAILAQENQENQENQKEEAFRANKEEDLEEEHLFEVIAKEAMVHQDQTAKREEEDFVEEDLEEEAFRANKEEDLEEGDLIEEDLEEGDLFEAIAKEAMVHQDQTAEREEEDLIEEDLIEEDLEEENFIEEDLEEEDLEEEDLEEEDLEEEDLIEEDLEEEDLIEEDLIEEDFEQEATGANEEQQSLEKKKDMNDYNNESMKKRLVSQQEKEWLEEIENEQHAFDEGFSFEKEPDAFNKHKKNLSRSDFWEEDNVKTKKNTSAASSQHWDNQNRLEDKFLKKIRTLKPLQAQSKSFQLKGEWIKNIPDKIKWIIGAVLGVVIIAMILAIFSGNDSAAMEQYVNAENDHFKQLFQIEASSEESEQEAANSGIPYKNSIFSIENLQLDEKTLAHLGFLNPKNAVTSQEDITIKWDRVEESKQLNVLNNIRLFYKNTPFFRLNMSMTADRLLVQMPDIWQDVLGIDIQNSAQWVNLMGLNAEDVSQSFAQQGMNFPWSPMNQRTGERGNAYRGMEELINKKNFRVNKNQNYQVTINGEQKNLPATQYQITLEQDVIQDILKRYVKTFEEKGIMSIIFGMTDVARMFGISQQLTRDLHLNTFEEEFNDFINNILSGNGNTLMMDVWVDDSNTIIGREVRLPIGKLGDKGELKVGYSYVQEEDATARVEIICEPTGNQLLMVDIFVEKIVLQPTNTENSRSKQNKISILLQKPNNGSKYEFQWDFKQETASSRETMNQILRLRHEGQYGAMNVELNIDEAGEFFGANKSVKNYQVSYRINDGQERIGNFLVKADTSHEQTLLFPNGFNDLSNAKQVIFEEMNSRTLDEWMLNFHMNYMKLKRKNEALSGTAFFPNFQYR